MVKYHFKTDQGWATLTNAEAAEIAGTDADHHRRDLFDAIGRGEHPTWTLKVQVMPYEDARTYRFNPFDLTKVWPHSDYPLITVGTMTLNKNPENFFAEIEQAAFSPGNTVPGIGLSPDKMCSDDRSPTTTRNAIGLAPTSTNCRSTDRAARRRTRTCSTAR